MWWPLSGGKGQHKGGGAWQGAKGGGKAPKLKRDETDGYVFVCSNSTQKECETLKLFGSPDYEMEQMTECIVEGRTLFLFNMQSYKLMGPFMAAGLPARRIAGHAFGGKFNAQVRVAAGPEGVIRDSKLEKRIAAGPKTFDEVVDLRNQLEQGEPVDNERQTHWLEGAATVDASPASVQASPVPAIALVARAKPKARSAAHVAEPHKPEEDALAQDVGGYMFMCNNATQGECASLGVFGAPDSELGSMQQHIVEGSVLFLFNANSRKLIGPFSPVGAPAKSIFPRAFGSRFSAHVRAVPMESTLREVVLDKRFASGSKSPKEVREMKQTLADQGVSSGLDWATNVDPADHVPARTGPKPPARNTSGLQPIAAGSTAGYVFHCDRETYGECEALRLIGALDSELLQMKRSIVDTTKIFLLNVHSLKLMGPFVATELPDREIEMGAFGGRLNSHVRVAPLCTPLREVLLEGCITPGPRTEEEVEVLYTGLLEHGFEADAAMQAAWGEAREGAEPPAKRQKVDDGVGNADTNEAGTAEIEPIRGEEQAAEQDAPEPDAQAPCAPTTTASSSTTAVAKVRVQVKPAESGPPKQFMAPLAKVAVAKVGAKSPGASPSPKSGSSSAKHGASAPSKPNAPAVAKVTVAKVSAKMPAQAAVSPGVSSEVGLPKQSTAAVAKVTVATAGAKLQEVSQPPKTSTELATGAAGYIFMCNTATYKECEALRLVGAPSAELPKMKRNIGDGTNIFLLNFQTLKLMGPFQPHGSPDSEIDTGAFGGKYSAQVRVAPLQAPLREVALEKRRSPGPVSAAEVDELAHLLEGGDDADAAVQEAWGEPEQTLGPPRKQRRIDEAGKASNRQDAPPELPKVGPNGSAGAPKAVVVPKGNLTAKSTSSIPKVPVVAKGKAAVPKTSVAKSSVAISTAGAAKGGAVAPKVAVVGVAKATAALPKVGAAKTAAAIPKVPKVGVAKSTVAPPKAAGAAKGTEVAAGATEIASAVPATERESEIAPQPDDKPGYLFMCSDATYRECEALNMAGSPDAELPKMKRSIAIGTRIFLFNFQKSTLMGTFVAVGAPDRAIVPEAFGAKYNAHVRVAIETAPVLEVKLDKRPPNGPKTVAEVDALQAQLAELGSPMIEASQQAWCGAVS